MSSKSYQLTFTGYWREPNSSSLPAHSGVYCVYTCTHDSRGKTVSLKRLIYIGEAGNVSQRVAGHEGWGAWRTYLEANQHICISTAAVNSADRDRVEAALIHHHQPPSNTEYKRSFPFDQTSIQTAGRNALLTSLFTVKRTEAPTAI